MVSFTFSFNWFKYFPWFTGWCFQTFGLFSIIYGMSSFPLTNSYFSEGLKPPTSYIFHEISPCFPSWDLAKDTSGQPPRAVSQGHRASEGAICPWVRLTDAVWRGSFVMFGWCYHYEFMGFHGGWIGFHGGLMGFNGGLMGFNGGSWWFSGGLMVV